MICLFLDDFLEECLEILCEKIKFKKNVFSLLVSKFICNMNEN